MPRCRNCGNRVSERFAKVKCGSVDDVPACPECPDKKMQDGKEYTYKG